MQKKTLLTLTLVVIGGTCSGSDVHADEAHRLCLQSCYKGCRFSGKHMAECRHDCEQSC